MMALEKTIYGFIKCPCLPFCPGYAISFQVLGNLFTFSTSCSGPWSCDHVLCHFKKCFPAENSKKCPLDMLDSLNELLYNCHKNNGKTESGHIVTRLMIALTYYQNSTLRYGCK